MPMRPPAGFISAFYDPLRNPNAPTIGTATGDNEAASVAFTAPANVGGSAISSYSAISSPGAFIGSAASSPVTVTGLTNGTAYTFAVWATNSYGPSAYSASSGSVTPALQRALFGGGQTGGSTRSNTISYVSISSTGNTQYFGDLTVARYGLACYASSTRAIWAGGEYGNSFFNVIDYVTITTTGNATDFGTLTANGRYSLSGASNETRGLQFAGYNASTGPGFTNVIDYVTIATTGNATDFGDTSVTLSDMGACSSTTRAVYAGGYRGSSPLSGMGYVTIASTGNSTSFGTLSPSVVWVAGCSNNTRGLFAGGATSATTTAAVNNIEYITIASTGNTTDFGDLNTLVIRMGTASSPTRGVFAGGTNSSGTQINTMDYVTIASEGNATDFGDLISAVQFLGGTSNCHGGL
jgi:hypothetical protein